MGGTMLKMDICEGVNCDNLIEMFFVSKTICIYMYMLHIDVYTHTHTHTHTYTYTYTYTYAEAPDVLHVALRMD